MNKKKWFIVSILLAVLAGVAFYFLYFIKTPTYALNETRLAVKEHDTTKFTRYVDVNSVMDNAFDDIIKAESKINNDNVFSNPFALGILHMLKPSVVDLMAQEALDKIAAKPDNTPKQPVDPVPDAMKRNLERHIPIQNLTVKDLKLSKHDGETATATLVLRDKDLEKDFIALKANVESAKKLGEALGARLKEKNINTVVFDRNGYLYHGVVKALADATRSAGIVF